MTDKTKCDVIYRVVSKSCLGVDVEYCGTNQVEARIAFLRSEVKDSPDGQKTSYNTFFTDRPVDAVCPLNPQKNEITCPPVAVKFDKSDPLEGFCSPDFGSPDFGTKARGTKDSGTKKKKNKKSPD